MKRSRFTEQQIVAVLKEADAGMAVRDLCRRHGISHGTYYRWKSKDGGLEASDLKRMKELEAELSKLKRLYADMALENAALKDDPAKAVTPPEKRAAIAVLVAEWKLSARRACAAVGLSRAAYYRPVDSVGCDDEIVSALNRLVEAHPRWGFWKCYDRLRRDGYPWNHKRVWRVYCAMRLNLKRRTKRRVPTRERQSMDVAAMPNVVWGLDFMSDALYSGRRFRTFNILDEGVAKHSTS